MLWLELSLKGMGLDLESTASFDGNPTENKRYYTAQLFFFWRFLLFTLSI